MIFARDKTGYFLFFFGTAGITHKAENRSLFYSETLGKLSTEVIVCKEVYMLVYLSNNKSIIVVECGKIFYPSASQSEDLGSSHW